MVDGKQDSMDNLQIDITPAYSNDISGYGKELVTHSWNPRVEGMCLIVLTWSYCTGWAPSSSITSVQVDGVGIPYSHSRTGDANNGSYAQGCSLIACARLKLDSTFSITYNFWSETNIKVYKIV